MFVIATNIYSALIRRENISVLQSLFLREHVETRTQTQTHTDTHRHTQTHTCLLYTSPSPRDDNRSRMPSSA